MASGKLRIELSRGDLKILLSAYEYMRRNISIEDELDMLYIIHVVELRKTIAKKIIDEKEKSITLDDQQALIFWLLWASVDLVTFAPAEAAVIHKMLFDVDQHIQSIKPRMDEQYIHRRRIDADSGESGADKAGGAMDKEQQKDSPEGVASG